MVINFATYFYFVYICYMKGLSIAKGTFNLNNSDYYIGSYYSENDLKIILNTDDFGLSKLNFINGLIDENEVHKAFYNNRILNCYPNRINNAKISFDEYIIIALIKKVYPNAIIEQQIKFGRKKIDLLVTINGVKKFIEFCGPSHFILSNYGVPKNILDRKYEIEKEFNIECIIFPYWIQKCESTIKSIFEKDVKGFGCIWSSNVHYGNFYYDDSANTIDIINKQFNCDRNGYGYFYVNSFNRNNFEHPIINKIINNKKDINILLPNGFKDKEKWLPECLHHLI